MTRLLNALRNSNLTGRFLAVVLVFSSANTIWPIYLWTHGQWKFHNWPPVLFWWLCALYYAFWVWLVMCLAKEYKQYPGISMDAFFGGALLAVASALRDADVMSDLSKKGFGAAAWVVYLSACALVVRNLASRSRAFEKEGELSSNSKMDRSVSAE